MQIISVVTGAMLENTYIVFDGSTKQAVVVDPGDDAQRIMTQIDKNGLNVTHILLTHGHADHIGAVDALRAQYGAKVAIHEGDADMLTSDQKNLSCFIGAPFTVGPADILLRDGDKIALGDGCIDVMHTPGHSPGSVCFLAGDFMFSGDTLFAGSIGRTDFPGSSMDEMRASLGNLKALEVDYEVYPGHGGATTLAEEKASNPYFGY